MATGLMLMCRCSSISFYWAMDGKIPKLNAHNIFLVRAQICNKIADPSGGRLQGVV